MKHLVYIFPLILARKIVYHRVYTTLTKLYKPKVYNRRFTALVCNFSSFNQFNCIVNIFRAPVDSSCFCH